MAYTLADVSTFCTQHGYVGTSAAAATQLDTWINDSIQRLASARDWPCYQKPYNLQLTAPYSTGTVTTTNDPTVTGSGTTFVAAHAGQEFYDASDSSRLYMIDTFTDTTHFELTQSYIGTEAAAQTYEIRYVRVTLPTDWDRPTGAMWMENGTELSYETVSLNEWQGLRMANRGKTSVPTHIAYDKGGPGQDSQHYAYVHPAPSAAKLLRGTYQMTPVTATASVIPDWPEKYLYLLHKLLRIELSTQDSKGGYGIETVEMQRLIEEAFQRDVQQRGPYKIRPQGGHGVIRDAHAVLSRITITGDRSS